jgi:hypothetical protein
LQVPFFERLFLADQAKKGEQGMSVEQLARVAKLKLRLEGNLTDVITALELESPEWLTD